MSEMPYKLCRAKEDETIIWIEEESGNFICSFWRLNSSGHQVPEPYAIAAESNARMICQLLNKGEVK